MSKTITLRVNDSEYDMISNCAKAQHRPISNFITSTVVNDIEASFFADSIEMSQIKNDRVLMEKITKGHSNAKKMKGKFVG